MLNILAMLVGLSLRNVAEDFDLTARVGFTFVVVIPTHGCRFRLWLRISIFFVYHLSFEA